MEQGEWIGVDLDGTLAYYEGRVAGDTSGILLPIGKPIPKMMERVKRWISEGKTVKIFTARATEPEKIPAVKQWLKEQGLPDLEVTNVKTHKLHELWDDRAVQVEKNTGERIGYSTRGSD